MTIDMFESLSLDKASFDLKGRMTELRSGFSNSLEAKYDAYMDMPDSVDGNISHWVDVDLSMIDGAALGALRPTFMDSVTQMYNGIDLANGKTGLGIKDISQWKIHKDYQYQNTKQHAGYAAEVIGTTKENMIAKLNGSDVKTYRADDRPDLFKRNDQYVDKIRVDASGNIVDRIQVKFVGDSAESCLQKMTSRKYDKYFNDGQINKMEVPKDYYDGMKKLIPEKIEGLEKQLARVTEKGDVEAIKAKEAQIERFKKIDQMLEKSSVTSTEAKEAVLHPKRYATKLFLKDTFAECNKAGLEQAAIAASITAAVSTVDNVTKVMDGEITAQEAFIDVAKDTGAAGGIAYGTAFISTAVSHTMSASSQQLIHSLGKAGVPAAVISFGVQSYDSVIDYAEGVIDGKQLAYDLGESAAQVGGSIAGAAVAGAALGSVVPGAGTVVGFGVGMVGGMVGCAVASEAYASAVEFGGEHADVLAEKAQEMASRTVDIAREVVPDKVGNVVTSLNEYATANNLPFRV